MIGSSWIRLGAASETELMSQVRGTTITANLLTVTNDGGVIAAV